MCMNLMLTRSFCMALSIRSIFNSCRSLPARFMPGIHTILFQKPSACLSPSFFDSPVTRSRQCFHNRHFSGSGSDRSKTEDEQHAPEGAFKVVNERVAYSRWRQLIERDVILPNGAKCSYDIISQDNSIVLFVWNTKTQSATLLREAHPGPMQFLTGVVAGMYEPKKHESPRQAAVFELEEEAHLAGGTWYNLLKDEITSIPVDKYSTNRVHCYLVLDPVAAQNPRALDTEEYITIEEGYSYSEILKLISEGKMNIMSSYACLLAFEKLRELGYLQENATK